MNSPHKKGTNSKGMRAEDKNIVEKVVKKSRYTKKDKDNAGTLKTKHAQHERT